MEEDFYISVQYNIIQLNSIYTCSYGIEFTNTICKIYLLFLNFDIHEIHNAIVKFYCNISGKA